MENRDPMRSGTVQPPGNWPPESRDIAERGRQQYDEARQYAHGVMQQTRGYVEDTVRQARDKLTEYREGGLESVKRDVTTYTREQPLTMLLIAAGLGLMLGLLMRPAAVMDAARQAYREADRNPFLPRDFAG